MKTTFIILILAAGLWAWAIVGAIWVGSLDLFGRRNNYDADYPLSNEQLFLGGPLVWWAEYKKLKSKHEREEKGKK